jgi:ring-1,2-phenylacetyl-CoA epoxidase subunit PaaD
VVSTAVITSSASPSRVERAWNTLQQVLDPEVPALSVCELGIVREVVDHGDVLEIVVTPTYSGCPATEVIAQQILDAIRAAGLGAARLRLQRAPAWSSDWISAEGRRKLKEYGIAPPFPAETEATVAAASIRRRRTPVVVACPRCCSSQTTQVSAFGSTACKALYRCLACLEPFEYFKPI